MKTKIEELFVNLSIAGFEKLEDKLILCLESETSDALSITISIPNEVVSKYLDGEDELIKA